MHRKYTAVAAVLVFATTAGPAAADCRSAIAAAAQAHGVPEATLLAIGQVESGLMPWTINADGRPQVFASRDAAIAATQALLAQGMRSIDIGCLQIDLAWHAQAFASLAEAFEPQANADYAARFLAGLYRQTGSWTAATARYHSAGTAAGARYAITVAAAVDSPQRVADAQVSPSLPGTPPSLAAVYGTRLLVQSGQRLAPNVRLLAVASPMIVP